MSPIKGVSRPEEQCRSWLRIVHLVVGVAGLVAFAETGQHMDLQLDHLVGMPDGPRALYRSAHIYLLHSALLHLALGLYLDRSPTLPGRLTQLLGSGLLFAAIAGFLFGFYVETPPAEIERPIVRLSIYWSLAGVLVHGAERFGTMLLDAREKGPRA